MEICHAGFVSTYLSPLRHSDFDTSLLVKPEILRLPLQIGGFKFETIVPQELGDELVNLGKRNLYEKSSSRSRISRSREAAESWTYISTNAIPIAVAKLEHISIHSLRRVAEPAFGIEDVSIGAKDVGVVVQRRRTHADSVPFGNESPCKLFPACWSMSRQGETDAGVKAHPFFATCYEIWELDSFGIPQVRTAEIASAIGFVDLVEKLLVDDRVFQDSVDDGTYRYGCCVASHNTIFRQKSN